jgi:hypothetical protein
MSQADLDDALSQGAGRISLLRDQPDKRFERIFPTLGITLIVPSDHGCDIRLLAVGHCGRYCRHHVSVHRTDGVLQKGVDQRALAALELSTDDHGHRISHEPVPRVLKVQGQIRPTPVGCDLLPRVEGPHDVGDVARRSVGCLRRSHGGSDRRVNRRWKCRGCGWWLG